jgi:hypothetical protein
MFMPKKPVSVTLEADNLTWLRGRALSGKCRSLSEALDDVVRAARLGGGSGEARSVAGTIDIAASDPDLEDADAEVAALFEKSAGRPVLLRERAPAYGSKRKGSGRG